MMNTSIINKNINTSIFLNDFFDSTLELIAIVEINMDRANIIAQFLRGFFSFLKITTPHQDFVIFIN